MPFLKGPELGDLTSMCTCVLYPSSCKWKKCTWTDYSTKFAVHPQEHFWVIQVPQIIVDWFIQMHDPILHHQQGLLYVVDVLATPSILAVGCKHSFLWRKGEWLKKHHRFHSKVHICTPIYGLFFSWLFFSTPGLSRVVRQNKIMFYHLSLSEISQVVDA